MSNKVLDLFCGAGGMSLGFKHAGFEIIGGVDNDEAALQTHKINFPGNYHFCGDISDITDSEVLSNFKNVDVIVGGPPCQGFSSANRYEKEENDPRNKLFFEYLRFIKLLKPKAFVIENVPGILTRDGSYAKDKIIEITSKLEYIVDVRVLNSDDYGVPQKRRRAFFIGIEKKYQTSFNFNNLAPIFGRTTVRDAIGDLMAIEGKTSKNPLLKVSKKTDIQAYYCNMDSDIIYNHEVTNHNHKVVERIKHVPEGGNWRNIPDYLWDKQRNNRHSSAYKRLSFNEPSITIDTGHMNYFHPKFDRIPTVRESARIQSFDDSFIFSGTKTQQYRQVGNAVPPLLAQSVAIELKKVISKNIEKSHKVIDLFCGAGGLSLGFEMAGFDSCLALDIWKDAISTYNANRESKVGTTTDIHNFTNNDLFELKEKYDIDGIIGGPPCQGFSLVGTRDSNDPRNSLYMEYVRFVSIVKPKFFVLENVKGLLSLEKGKFKKDIKNRFEALNYTVNHSVLRASDYGVPQARERVFFVGLNKDFFGDTIFDFAKIQKSNIVSTSEAISDLPSLEGEKESYLYSSPPSNNFQRAVREGCSYIYNHERTNHTDKTKSIIALVPDGGTIKDLPEEYYKVRNYNNAFRRMDSKLPSNTIDCGHRNYFHYKENRVPTVRESARIQSFPDLYVFAGSRTSQYKQVGNAVPPLLAKNIAEAINNLINIIKLG